jgi:hypothetical protein
MFALLLVLGVVTVANDFMELCLAPVVLALVAFFS